MAKGLADRYEGSNVSLSLPSTRVDAFNITLANEFSRNGRRSGLRSGVLGHVAACCLAARRHASPAAALPSAACAAARRAIGTRKGEHET